MKVKTPAKVSGIPECNVSVSPGVTDQGMAQVMVVLTAVDANGMPTVVASLRMTAKEATVFAARVVDNANQATLMSAKSMAVRS